MPATIRKFLKYYRIKILLFSNHPFTCASICLFIDSFIQILTRIQWWRLTILCNSVIYAYTNKILSVYIYLYIHIHVYVSEMLLWIHLVLNCFFKNSFKSNIYKLIGYLPLSLSLSLFMCMCVSLCVLLWLFEWK